MRHGWRDSLAAAGDLALLGFLVTLAALPVVTAGAAVLTGSHAVGSFVRDDRWPPARECRAVFRAAVRPGLAGSALVTVAAGLLAADFVALRSGAAPGGVPVAAVVLLLALAGAGATARAVATWPLRIGEQSGSAYRYAPPRLPAAAGVTGLAAGLALLVHPVLIPVLIGYWMFALHVLTIRDEAQPPSGGRRSRRNGGPDGAG